MSSMKLKMDKILVAHGYRVLNFDAFNIYI